MSELSLAVAIERTEISEPAQESARPSAELRVAWLLAAGCDDDMLGVRRHRELARLSRPLASHRRGRIPVGSSEASL
jgi:hypothetical protein